MAKMRFLNESNLFILIIAITLPFISHCGGDWKGLSFIEPSATLTWGAPATNLDGTPTNDLGGYVIYYGTSTGNYTNWIDVGNVSSYNFYDLPPDTYYFAMSAYDVYGNESGLSNELSKEIFSTEEA